MNKEIKDKMKDILDDDESKAEAVTAAAKVLLEIAQLEKEEALRKELFGV